VPTTGRYLVLRPVISKSTLYAEISRMKCVIRSYMFSQRKAFASVVPTIKVRISTSDIEVSKHVHDQALIDA
jgi:hypothetical protein